MRTRHHNQKLVFLERQRKLFAGALACALLAGCGAYNDQSYDGAEYLRRWKVTDSSGKVLSQGCAKEPKNGASSNYWATRITIHAATGSVVIDEDNLGSEHVFKSKVEQQLPTSDAYWCSTQDTTSVGGAVYGLGTLHVLDADPPATLQSVNLVNPRKDSGGDVMADGFKAQFQIRHPGVVHLGYSIQLLPVDTGTDGGADAGQTVDKTYAAMTIQ